MNARTFYRYILIAAFLIISGAPSMAEAAPYWHSAGLAPTCWWDGVHPAPYTSRVWLYGGYGSCWESPYTGCNAYSSTNSAYNNSMSYVGIVDVYNTTTGQGRYGTVNQAQTTSNNGTMIVMSGTPLQLDWACQDQQTVAYAATPGNGCYGASGPTPYYFANTATVTNADGATVYSGSSLTGTTNVTVTGAAGANKSYALQCRRSDGATWTATVPVQISTANLSIAPASPTVAPGGSTMLNWSVSHTLPASCKITNQAGTVLAQEGTTNTYSYTGGNQTYTVPAGVTSIFVTLAGAGGGGQSCSYGDGSGGTGGYTQGILAVTPGQVLTIIAGQGGLFNGGATYGGGGAGGSYAGAGGGRSAIRNSSGVELVTAGGGGGSAGLGCYLAAAPTQDIFTEAGGKLAAAMLLWPGTAHAMGGAHLAASFDLSPQPGNPGGGTSGNIGGASPYAGANSPDTYGGGGGGGYEGGASNTSSLGGNGGTGYCGAASACTTTTGGGSAQNTNGSVSISVGQVSGSVSSGALATNTTFTLSCKDESSTPLWVSTTVSVGSPPTATISAGSGNGVARTVYTNTPVSIVATYTPAGSDTLTATAINGNDQVTSVSCGTLTPYNASCWTVPDATKTYTFTPSSPGTYTFYATAKTAAYNTYNNYKSVTVTVVTPCPNGSGTAGACTACDAGYVLVGGNCAVQCPNGSGPAGACIACNAGYVLSGGNCVIQCPNGSGPAGACIACNAGYVLSGGSCIVATPSIGTFSINPVRVRKNTSTPVTFSYTVTNPGASCTISGPAGFTPLTINPVSGVPGTRSGTVMLSQASNFTLTCGSVSVQNTIGLIPATQEL